MAHAIDICLQVVIAGNRACLGKLLVGGYPVKAVATAPDGLTSLLQELSQHATLELFSLRRIAFQLAVTPLKNGSYKFCDAHIGHKSSAKNKDDKIKRFK